LRGPGFAGRHAFADEFGDRILQFLSFMHCENFDCAHEIIRKIKSSFHKSQFSRKLVFCQ